MFGKLYAGELKKMFSLKTALIMIAIFIFGFAVITIALNSFKDLTVGAIETDGPEVDISIWETFKRNISEEQAKAELNVLKAQLKELEKEKRIRALPIIWASLRAPTAFITARAR